MATAKKLPSGKYRCRASYTDEFGNYKTKSFTAATKKEAENLASNFIMEREHKAKPENKTLGELADAFLESKSEILSPSTLRGYKSIRKNAFKSIIDVRLGILTKELYQKAVNEYAKGRSPKTVLSAHTFFNNLLKENDIFVGEKATLPRKAKKETEIPTTVEVQSFLKAIYGTRLYLYCLFSVCLGLRKSETIALQWKDIDWEKQSVSINKARVRDSFGDYVEKQTKTFDGTRTLHLPPVLISALGEAGDPDEYIISDSPKALESLYQREKTRLGFDYKFHALRHYLKNLDLYKYFTQSTPIVESRKLKELVKYIDDPRTECSLTPEDFEALEKYISIIVDSATHNIALSNIRAIKTKDIAYYKIEGGTQFVADVKGGGANLAGAVYGGIIAGGAGAVVGSNLGTEIKTDIVRKDDRKLFLYYKVDGETKSEEIITDNIDCILSLLREWIPNKEYSYVVANSNINTTINETKVLPNYDVPKIEEQTAPVKRSYAELKELKELLDLGIITQEEFDQKKREILG